MTLICSPVGLLDVSQAGLELASGGVGALLFSQCNMHGEDLYVLGAQCVKSLTLFGALFLPSVAPACQQNF
jgi:hypothetical protein